MFTVLGGKRGCFTVPHLFACLGRQRSGCRNLRLVPRNLYGISISFCCFLQLVCLLSCCGYHFFAFNCSKAVVQLGAMTRPHNYRQSGKNTYEWSRSNLSRDLNVYEHWGLWLRRPYLWSRREEGRYMKREGVDDRPRVKRVSAVMNAKLWCPGFTKPYHRLES